GRLVSEVVAQADRDPGVAAGPVARLIDSLEIKNELLCLLRQRFHWSLPQLWMCGELYQSTWKIFFNASTLGSTKRRPSTSRAGSMPRWNVFDWNCSGVSIS